eukprot:g1169.t1
MLLAVHLRLPYSSWENLQVNHPKLRSARLARALSKQCGLPSWRLVAKASRPFSMTSTVLDLLLLPANFGAHQYSNMSAAQALQRAKLALKVPEKLLRQVLSFPGGKEIGVERLEVVSRTVGRMCVHPPVVEHAHDLSPCAFTLSGHLCPLVCEAGFVHSGSLACQDGEWLRPHCEEISCDKKPDVENAEEPTSKSVKATQQDLSHCANSASGSLCGLECQAGYLRRAWVGGECRPKRCRHVPRVLHADQHALSRCRNLESGSECTLQCEAGFLPTGTGKLQCHLGNFRLQSLCEPAACHQMPKVRNSASNLAECSGLEHSTTCDFKCSDGYQKVGMLQCFHGRFTSARCEPADCKDRSPLCAPPLGPKLQRHLRLPHADAAEVDLQSWQVAGRQMCALQQPWWGSLSQEPRPGASGAVGMHAWTAWGCMRGLLHSRICLKPSIAPWLVAPDVGGRAFLKDETKRDFFVQIATGGGKSLIMADLLDELADGKQACVIVPKLDLMEQIGQLLEQKFPHRHVSRAAKRIFFSATLRNPPDFDFGLRPAIRAGVIKDYTVMVPVLTEGDPRPSLVELIKDMPLARKILAFCNTVHEALDFTALLSNAGIAAAHYNAHTSTSERQNIWNNFQHAEAHGGIRVLVTGHQTAAMCGKSAARTFRQSGCLGDCSSHRAICQQHLFGRC